MGIGIGVTMKAFLKCEHCKDWGETDTREQYYLVTCPKCGRKTWPNLGVNLPAGMAVSVAHVQCVNYLMMKELLNEKM